MKKNIIILILLLSVFSVVSGEAKFKFDTPFGWMSPEIMAQGGSYTAIASGYNSLMTNPAGFAMSRVVYNEKVNEAGERVVEKKRKGEITILGVLPWVIANPFTLVDDMSDGGAVKALLNQSKTNGVGGGAQIGIAYVGHGFGFGLITTVDMLFPQSDSAIALIGDVSATAAFVGGYAHRFELGPVGLSIGADIRPMWRVKLKDIDINTIFGAGSGEYLSSIDALTGFAIGFDAGIIADWEFLSLGLSLRDIGHTRYLYSKSNAEKIKSSPFTGNEYNGLDYITPMTMRVGIGIHPDFGRIRRFIDPKIHAEYVLPLINSDLVASYEKQSFWSNLNLGAEIKLFSFLSLRGGFSGGYLSAGLGIDMYVAELNAAIFSRETGSNAGSNQQMGASVEFAFRF